MALTFEAASSSSLFLLQASSRQSGYTSETNRILLPSGNHIAPSASVEMLVIFLGSPLTAPEAESKSWVHTCDDPPRRLTKRNLFPSGAQRPPVSPAGSDVNCRDSPPARGTIQRCDVRLLAFTSTSTAEKSTHLLSGEMAGPPMRLSAIMSSNVNGRLPAAGVWVAVWPKAGAVNKISARKKRRIGPPGRSNASVNFFKAGGQRRGKGGSLRQRSGWSSNADRRFASNYLTHQGNTYELAKTRDLGEFFVSCHLPDVRILG